MISEQSLKEALAEEMKALQSPILAESISLSTRFKEDLDLDSLDMMEIMLGLEDRLNIKVIDESLFKECRTFGDALKLINNHE